MFTSTFVEKSRVEGWRKNVGVMALPEVVGDSEDQVEVKTKLDSCSVLQGGEVRSVTFQPNESSKVVCLVGDKAVQAALGGG